MTFSIVQWLTFIPLMAVFAQPPISINVEHIPLDRPAAEQAVRLSKPFVIPSTIRVTLDSIPFYAFTFSRASNSLTLRFDSTVRFPAVMMVSYSSVSLSIQPEYSLRTLTMENDSLGRKMNSAVVSRSEGIFTNMFGPELSKSGSISRGFLVGSTRDLTLNSGFRLQMAGKLSDDIDIIAALTDENTPIQPQGNTQTLQEIDNVFVEIKSPVYTATLGDFQFSSRSGEFVNVNRKLQGAKILADHRSITPQTQIQLTGATSRGKFNSNPFQGIEGVQGPYRLTGKNNERAIIIIAGSEKVFVDGEPMVRGENKDYTIEYGSAEVTFTSRRLITGASRIVVDFEYSDRQYTRNFIGADADVKLSEMFSLRANYFREGDDPDAPIDLTLSESDKALLRQAGNNSAALSGAVLVGRDSLGIGKGNFRIVDTTINSVAVQFYRWEQNTVDAVYRVTFSPVGQGNGDYRRLGIGRYEFVGILKGDFSPIVILPAPQLHQLYSFQSTVRITNAFTVEGEYAASDLDGNRFSSIGDNTNSGGAAKVALKYSPKNIMIGSASVGSAELSLSERYKQRRFLALDRTDVVEFGRKWSTDSLLTGTSADEEIREAALLYVPVEMMSLSAGYGTLERKGEFTSARYDGSAEWKNGDDQSATYRIEKIMGKENRQLLSNDWFRQKGGTEYAVGRVIPSFRFEEEKRSVKDDRNDSLLNSSFGFLLYSPKVSLRDFYGFDASTEMEWRNDEAVHAGSLVPQSSSLTQQYSLLLKEVQNFTASSVVTLRKKSYTTQFQSVNQNQQTTLISLQSRYRPFSQGLDIDLFYDAATQRTAKLERYFFKVRKGEGQYTWTDVNGNGAADLNDEREFLPDRYDGEYIALTLNSESLIPIINVKASSRVRITPSKFLRDPSTTIEKAVTSISSETFFRLEERSTQTDIQRIYLLDLSAFLDPRTTLMGYQFFQQDLFLFEYNPEYSFRFRFNQRNGLSQFSSGIERNYSRERSLRSRFQFSDDIANQTDIIFKNDNALSSSSINRPRSIEAAALSSDLSYRPERNIELGLKIETSSAEDRTGAVPVTADFNGQSVRFVYGFLGNGQVRSEISREEVLLHNRSAGYVPPYELTAGRDVGRNYLWSLSSEYRMGGNIQFSLLYSGRTTSRQDVVHTGRMEVRAFF